MKRPLLATIAMVVQWALGAASAALMVYLLVLTRSQETLTAKDPAGEIQGLKVGAAVFILPTIFYLVAARGMQKGKLWGWWVALLTNIVSAAIFVYNMFDGGISHFDTDELPFAAGFLVVVGLLLLPGVRKSYRPGRGARAA
jgi:hypothetical protein